MPATILVIEDEPAIQLLIASNLRQAGYTIQQAYRAEQALDFLTISLPNLILLDWMLPGMSGLDLAKRLRANQRTQQIPLIMLTARSSEADKVQGLEIGADDFITKPFSPKELLARIHALLRRMSPHVTDEAIIMGDLQLDPAKHRVSSAQGEIELGPTEFRLLHFLMTHAERIYSRMQLLDLVWGDHAFIEERTIDVHIRRLRKALEASGHDAWVQTVRGMGYRFSERANDE